MVGRGKGVKQFVRKCKNYKRLERAETGLVRLQKEMTTIRLLAKRMAVIEKNRLIF